MTDKLLPCPFCGGQPIVVTIEPHTHKGGIAEFMPDHPGSAYIDCACGVGLIDADEDSVAKRWNVRTSDQAQVMPVTDAMVKAGAAAMCCQAQTLGCAAKNKDSEFSTCMLSTFLLDARRCLEAAYALPRPERLGDSA
jgi:hypothetical protein